jgi:uncharacterized protein
VRLRLLALAACAAAAVAAFPGVAVAKDCAGLPKHGNLPVVDAANVVPPEDEGYLVADLLAYRLRGKHAIVAVTVPTLGGDDVSSYAQRMFDCWGIGDAQSDNGMLILVALREQRIRIELGAGLEGRIGQPELDAALDEMVAPLRAGEIAVAFRAAAESLVAEVGGTLPDSRGDAGTRPTATPTHPGDVSDTPAGDGSGEFPPLPNEIPYGVSPFSEHRGPGTGFGLLVPLIFVLGIGSTIARAVFRGGLGAVGAGWGGGFSRFGGGGWNSASLLRGGSWDDDDSSSWSGGSDGGSSFGGGSSSDSGSSFGGGSSGGGGASGSW